MSSPVYFRGMDVGALGLDQAYLNVTSVGYRGGAVFAYRRSGNCDGCPFQRVGEISDEGTVESLSTHYPWYYRLRTSGQEELVLQNYSDNSALCTSEVSLGEHGVYDLRLSPDGDGCLVSEALAPSRSGWALLVWAIILLLAGAVFRLLVYLDRRGKLDGVKAAWRGFKLKLGFEVSKGGGGGGGESEEESAKKKTRLKSLDTFRGITIALMIFVNDGAGGFYFFEHATWNGLYLADLAFPWFMWIMGFCIPMSVRSLQRRKTATFVALWGIFVRSVKLFLLGFIWGNANWINLARVRIPGVLQRFAFVYFVVASTAFLVARFFSREERREEKAKKEKASDGEQGGGGDAEGNNNNGGGNGKGGVSAKFLDITADWPRWVVAFAFLVVHTCVVYLLPVPGCPTGYVGPGGLHDGARHDPDCIGGATGYVDRLVFTVSHIYSNPTPKATYQTTAFDPEGLLGCFSSVFQVFLGYQAGQTILSYRGHGQRSVRFVIWGIACTFIGLALSGFSLNHGPIPINKNIWSLSYVMVTSGLAFALMAVVYHLVDVKRWWGGEPFFYAGMNSILLYLGHGTAWQMFPFNYVCGPMNTHWDRLPESLLAVVGWLIVAYVLYRKKIFIVV